MDLEFFKLSGFYFAADFDSAYLKYGKETSCKNIF